jgi:hypothetical protein
MLHDVGVSGVPCWRAAKDKTANSFAIEILGDLEEHLAKWKAIKRGRVTKTPSRSHATGRFQRLTGVVGDTIVASPKDLPASASHPSTAAPSVFASVPRETVSNGTRPKRSRPALANEGPTTARRPSAPRVRANELVWIHVAQPASYPAPLKTEQMIKMLMAEFSITRNTALSAATKAVNQLDPGNSLRRSRDAPVARALPEKLLETINNMAREGMSGGDIARQLGLHKRTVNQNLQKMRGKS